VTATDLTGLSAIDTFALEVAGYPQGAGGSITLDEETSFTITAADFGFTDPFDNPPDSLARVRLTTVPALGTLRLNGNSVAAGDFAPLVPTPGVTWTRRTTLANSRLVCSADAGRLLAVLTPAGGPSVYRSVNGGQTWLPLNFFGSHLARPTCAAASADGSRWVVAAQDRGRIHTSADFGQTWVARGGPRNWAALACSADGSRILAVDLGDASGLAYISTDFGVTWTPRPQVIGRWVAAASSADGIKLAIASTTGSVGTVGVVMTSSDGGTTWSLRSPHADWTWLASSGDGARLAAASARGLFLSDDAGETWRQALAVPNLTSVSSSIDGRTLAATAANGRIHVTTDRGATWAAAGETADWSCVVSASDGKNMVAAGSTGIFTSSPSTPSLVYTPPENGAGSPYTTLTYQVEDSGPPGLNLDSVLRTLSIHVTNVNDPPVAVEPLPAQIVPPSAALNYQISATAFIDPDPGDRLSFGATLDDGQSLPFWLNFDASTRTVAAAAGAAVPGALRLRITASDQGAPPGHAQALLSLTFLSHPPAGSDTTITLTEDNNYRFTPANFRFSDPEDTPPNLFSRILLASIPATGTLTIDGITLGAGEYVSMLPDARMAWSQQAERKAWQDIAMSTDGSRLVAVWGSSGTEAPSGEITLSSDGGATWTPALPGKYWNGVAMTPDGTKVVAAARNDRLAISVNSGQSWTQRGPAEDWGSVAISKDGTRILAAPYYGTLSVSQNGGLTWTSKVYSMPWSKVAMSDDGSVMAAVGVGLWISLDSGATWTQRGGEGSWASVVLSSDGERVAAINGEQFLYSLDFGTSWETRGPSITWSRLAGSSDATRLVAADRFSGRLFVSSDSGHTWTPKERINNWTGLASSDDGSFLAAASSPGFIFTSVAAVPELVFKPAANAWGIPYAQFAFRAGDSGTPGSNLAESVASVTIDVVSVNDPPTVAIPISDRAATEYAAFNYTFPPGTFTDADAGTVLTYAAALATGAPLPAWLQFNPATRTFAGVPGSPDTGILDIVVTASDSATPPLSTTDTFQISVRNVDEPPSGVSATLTLAEDVPWVFTPEDFGFSDPTDVPPGAFSRVKLTTLPSAGVLAVDGVPAVPGSFARLTSSPPGAVWTPRGTTTSWWAVCSSDDGNRLAAVVNGARIHTSVDAGSTWTARETSRSWYAIATSADGQRLAAIVMGGLIYTSQDAGATWVPRATPRAWRAIASSADGSRLAALDSPGQIHVSSDFGATWTPRESARAWYSIASSADGLKLAAVEQNGQIYTSADAGASWSARESARNWYSIASSADGTRLAAVVQSGRIYHSSDGGATWTARAANGFWRAIASSVDGNRLVAVAPGDKIYTSAIEPAQSLAFIPAANAIGSPYASFTFQVEDDGPPNANLDASPDTVTFHVTESNDAPTLNPIADPPLMAAEAGAQTIALSGISAGGGESQALSVSAVSSNPALVPHPVVNYTSPDAMASMTYTPMQGAAGNVILTVTVRDTGGTANGGIDQAVRAFTVSLITPFQRWALQNGLPADPAAVGGLNFFAYAFGLNSDGSERNPIAVAGGSIQRRGMPSLLQTGGGPAPQFSAIFGRRKDSGLDYQVQFCSDFSDWETSLTSPVPVAQDAIVEAFSVPFPARLASGRVPRFFRIKIIGP